MHGRIIAHEYIGLIEIMPPATLPGVGVITKLYFVIFVAVTESMTLNLAKMYSRSYILAAIESQCTTLYRPLIVGLTFALSSTVSETLPVLYARSPFSPTPLLFRLKFGVFPLELIRDVGVCNCKEKKG